jgi:hypothetical protein
MSNIIGRGSRIDGLNEFDFAWCDANGAAQGFYVPVSNLERFLRSEGVNTFEIVWNSDDEFVVVSNWRVVREALIAAGRDFDRAQQDLDDASTALYAAIVDAVAAGTSEVEAAKLGGVDRMTVRRALGKR